ncbi:MAG: response regulator [Planctomycetaceae bacterium]
MEDNPAEARRLSDLLGPTTRCRMRVSCVSNLAEAKASLTSVPADVVLLDWVLPDRYGVEALRDLQVFAPQTPVLMMFGWDDDAAAVASLRAGAQDVLIKERMTTAILEQTIRYAVERKHTEAALRQTEEMYRSLIESLPINVFRKDAQGRFVFANQRFCDELHKRLDELVGRTDFAFFPPELAEKYRRDDQTVMRNRRVVEDIEAHRTPDGQRLHVQVMKAPATDAKGNVVGTQTMFWDVTPRIEAEEALQHSHSRFKKLFDANIIGIMLADLSGRVLEANDAYLALTGYTREDLIAGLLRWDKLTPPEFRTLDLIAIDSLNRTGVCPPWEKQYIRKDGSRVPVMLGVSMLDNSTSECICFVLNMTKQKQSEAQLQRAKEEADSANQSKSLFLANMSHEIRTPMNAIIGLTELVLDSPLTPQQRDNLSAVSESAESLLSIINHILDFSKIEAGKLELDVVEFSLRTMVSGALKTLALTAHRKGLELVGDIRPDVPDRVIGDVVRLRQIVMNLLGNAIKFTDAGEVVLRVAVSDRDASTLELRMDVTDTGIGIPADRQHVIFEAFEQVHTSINRKYGGTGLGLSITSKLAELMGGRVWLTSEAGRGSTFFATSRVRPTSSELTASSASPSPLDGLRVLIVDDNATSRQQLLDLLTSWRLRPMAVPGAKEALNALKRVRTGDNGFAFTLIDADMPEVDGFALATTIREEWTDRAGHLLVLLSSPDRAAELARCDQAGLNASITKPVNESELLDTLMSLRLGAGDEMAPTLPARPVETARTALRVLLVEDSLFNQKLAVALLEKRGHLVAIANNGREAVDLFFRQPFDRVLMDVQMPEMDGLEATQVIRQREARTGSHVPIIAMTAQAMTGDRERCLNAGMDEYLTKPIRSDLMYETLEAEYSKAVFVNQKTGEPGGVSPRTVAEPQVRGLTPSGSPNSGLVDWALALSVAGGDRKLLRDVVEACLEDWPRWMRDFERGLAQQDAPVFRRAAHSIRGACRTFGLEPLVVPAQELETLAVAGNLAAAEQLLKSVRPVLQACQTELQEFLTKPRA